MTLTAKDGAGDRKLVKVSSLNRAKVSKLIPQGLLEELKSLEQIKKLDEESIAHLEALKQNFSESETTEGELHQLQIDINLKRNDILKEVLEVCSERQSLCNSVNDEDNSKLDKEIAEMESASLALGKMVGQESISEKCGIETQNLEMISALKNSTTRMEVEVVKMISSDEKVPVPESVPNVPTSTTLLLAEQDKAKSAMYLALKVQTKALDESQRNFVEIEETLKASLEKISKTLEDVLAKKCEDKSSLNLLEENRRLMQLQLKVLKEAARLDQMIGNIAKQEIKLNYDRYLFEDRLKLSTELNLLSEKKERCRNGRRTEATVDSHPGVMSMSSANCSFSIENPSKLDPF